MSGHSKWSTIKRQKGVADIKRGQTFSKIANIITIATKLGGLGDPAANPRLRVALEQARSVNMPKDNIQRAIERGLGKGKEALQEVVYEGFGPGNVAFYLEGMTDNKLRTTQEIKNLFERSGGRLAGVGATSFLFTKKGEIRVKSKGGSMEDEMLELIDLGAEDVEDFLEDKNIQRYLVYTEGSKLSEMSTKITQAGYGLEDQDLVMKPTILQQVNNPELAKKVVEFAERLEEADAIQKVYANFDIADELLQGG